MANKKSKWYNNQLINSYGSSVLGAILIPLGTGIYAWFKGKPFLPTLIALLNYSINFKLWYAIGILFVFIVIKFLIRIRKPGYLSYKTDTFKVMRWVWDYSRNMSGQYYISNLSPECDKCKIPMRNLSTGIGQDFKCPKCNKDTNNAIGQNENIEDIKALIDIKIQNKTYKK